MDDAFKSRSTGRFTLTSDWTIPGIHFSNQFTGGFMKKHLLILSVLVLSLSIALVAFATLKENKIELKVGDAVYACACGAGCDCDTISRNPGKCSCGGDLVKAKVAKVEVGKAYLKADNWPKKRAFKTEGKYICACGPGCNCDTISQKPGKCGCGSDLKEYKK
jgi:hypothetical protein